MKVYEISKMTSFDSSSHLDKMVEFIFISLVRWMLAWAELVGVFPLII